MRLSTVLVLGNTSVTFATASTTPSSNAVGTTLSTVGFSAKLASASAAANLC